MYVSKWLYYFLRGLKVSKEFYGPKVAMARKQQGVCGLYLARDPWPRYEYRAKLPGNT